MLVTSAGLSLGIGDTNERLGFTDVFRTRPPHASGVIISVSNGNMN